jgi:uncharacterized protein
LATPVHDRSSILRERAGSALLRVSLRPGARRDAIVGVRDGRLVVAVSALPTEGRANDALRKLLAREAGVAPGRVSIVRGLTAREKTVAFEGVRSAWLAARFGISG